MIHTAGPLATDEDSRYAALLARLRPIRAMEDGTLHMEPVGIHFHVLTKEESMVRFWLVEQNNADTGVIQSEIDLDDPLALQEAYTQAMLLTLAWQPEPRAVYMAGVGGGRVALALHHFFPEAELYCAEIEPEIVEIAHCYFGLPRGGRLHIAVEDGREYLARRTRRYDLILLDVFLDNGYSPYRMATVEFFSLCREHLAEGGALAMNLLANDPFVERKLHSLAAVFPTVRLFTSRPVDGDENLVALASAHGDLSHDELAARAAAVETGRHLPYRLAALAAVLAPVPRGGVAPLFDAAPPAGYFDSLPSFDAPYSQVAPDRPCPCGSGRRFAACHGRRLPRSV
ncbi:MAG: fused MFS/spermidine synthase [Caldilineaceae bacterium]|nr:fused MFS/spermidine synthase [Caldilineaceae bacterium]